MDAAAKRRKAFRRRSTAGVNKTQLGCVPLPAQLHGNLVFFTALFYRQEYLLQAPCV
ncbi:unnamed protein product [Ectocarpus sp. 12 AP-2014]